MSDLGFHYWERGTADVTLLLLHGTGGSEHDLVDLGRAVLPGANLLSPRGKVSENGMARYFRRLAEGVFDLEDLHRRTKELAQFVTDAAAEYGFDAGKVVALGFSNGANIAASLLLGGYDVPAAAVLLAPMVPFEPKTAPDLKGRAVFIGAGQADGMVPTPLTERLEELLKAGGASVTTHWHPGGHRITRDEVEAAAEWLQRQHIGS
jgi:phospholipase/carboxylesterase